MLEMFAAPIARSFLTDSDAGESGVDRPSPIILPFYLHPPAPGQEQMRVLLYSTRLRTGLS